jgi:hypothetical protein
LSSALSSSSYNFTLVLLLGSYDPITKNLLDILKREIAKKYGGTGLFVFLLEEVDVYNFREYFVLTERWTDENISIHIFQHDGSPVETYELKLAREEQIDDKVKSLLQEKYGDEYYVTKLTVIDKLIVLMNLSKQIIIVRDREETRGGEIFELTYCIFQGYRDKVCIFKREGIQLSSMLMEFLDQNKVIMRTYSTREELIENVLRFLSYNL